MKTPNLRLIVVTSLLTFTGALAVPVSRAADDKAEAAAVRKAHHDAEVLKKYDANQDGKLDDTERAVQKSDKAKAKAERDAKRRERAERESEQESK